MSVSSKRQAESVITRVLSDYDLPEQLLAQLRDELTRALDAAWRQGFDDCNLELKMQRLLKKS